jgi:hypothetical protein
MGAPDILGRLAAAGVLLTRNGDKLVAIPREHLDDELRVLIRNHKAELMAALPDPAMEARRQRVLELLAVNPSARYAVLTDTQADPEAVILTLAIRGQATCELLIPRDKFDGILLLDLLNRHGAMIH